jgi:putative permease
MTDTASDLPAPVDSGHRAGPTDIDDPFVREEAKKAMVWLGIAALMALVVLLAQPLVVIFGGLVFAALIDGGARLLGRVLKIGRGWRIAIVLAFAALFIIGFLLYAGSQIADQAAALPAIIRTQTMRLLAWAEHHGLRVDTKFITNIENQALGGVSQITGVVGGLIGGATTLFLILVLGIYFAVDPAPYRRGLAWMLPSNMRDHFEETLSHMGHSLRRLLMGRLLGMAIEGVSIGVALALYGVPMAALLGLIAGMLAFLPNIGAPISGALMVLVGFSGGSHMAFYCIGVYLVVQTVDGNIIVPMVAKKAADLAPALVLAMQLVMGVLFGILGLALADPLLAMLKVLIERQSDRDQGEPKPESKRGPDAADHQVQG